RARSRARRAPPPRRSRAPSAGSRGGRRTRRGSSRSAAAGPSASSPSAVVVERLFADSVETPPDGVNAVTPLALPLGRTGWVRPQPLVEELRVRPLHGRVVRAERRALPLDVGRHTRAHHRPPR